MNDATLPARPGRAPMTILVMVALIAIVQTLRSLLPLLARQDLYEDDACQHIWWTYRFADPALFPNDPAAAFYSLPMFSPPGWQAIYRALVPIIDAQRLSDLIPFFLAIPVWVLAWRMGRRVGGVVAVVFIVAANMLQPILGGFARSFSLPLLMLGLWALMSRRLWALGLTFLIAALVYPLPIASLGLASAVVLGVRIYEERRPPRGWVGLLVLGVLSLAILAYSRFQPLPPGVGPKTTLAVARTMPEFLEGGRSVYFIAARHWKVFWFTARRSGIGWRLQTVVIMTIAVAVSVVMFRKLLPLEVWIFLIAAVATFFLAHLLLFTLYLPNRHTVLALPLFAMLWMAAVAGKLWEKFKSARWATRFIEKREPARRLAMGLAIVALLAFTGLTAHEVSAKLRNPNVSEIVSPDDAAFVAAMHFLETLPKDALIAAHPFDADHIPILSRRSVLAGKETSLPYYLGYYNAIPPKIDSELEACYASNWDEVDQLASRWGVRYFLVNSARYLDVASIEMYEPYRAANLARVARGQEIGFVLQQPLPADRVMFERGGIAIIRVGKW